MNPIALLLLFGSIGFTLGGCANHTPAPSDVAPAIQWQRWEGSLTAAKTPARPYAGVEVDVHFSGPGGRTLEVPAFWDEERGFRFRAAFPAVGLWRWRTTCNDPTDTGLQGQSGAVRVGAYAGDNAFFRHGDLRVSADRRYLIHADGTPFLWMGDTAWNTAWKSTAAEWREYVDTRARQRFNVLQVVATGLGSKTAPPPGRSPFHPDGSPDAVVWRELEDKIACANDRGVMVLLVGVGKSHAGYEAPQRSPAFARYLAGRLAGHLVIFSPSMDQRLEPVNEESGARLHRLTNHLITQHPGTHLDTARRYHDADYTDFCGLQSGHHSGRLEPAYAAAREWTLEMWRRPPVKPVINIETMYDARGNDRGPNWREQDVRKLGWIAWLSGSRGYTYGAGDIPPKVPAGAGGVWRFSDHPAAYDHWRKAMLWPSAGQMTHLRDFFAGIDWWRLVPAPDLVKNQADDPRHKMAVSSAAAGDLLVAYLPDNAEIVLDLSQLRPGLSARWFNPVTGRSEPASIRLEPATAVTLRRPGGWSDATLLLTTAK